MPEFGEEGDAESHVSSFSGGGNCVEVTRLPSGDYVVRHSAGGDGEVTFSPGQWRAFVAGVKADEFDF